MDTLKNKNVFYLSHQPYLFDMAKKMFEEHNWQPVYWFTEMENNELVKSYFPDTIVHNYYEAVKGLNPPHLEKIISLKILDDELLKEFSQHETVCLKMLDRNDVNNSFNYQQRLEHYHDLLSYWYGVLESLKIDIVVFENIPHQLCDYLIYLIAHKLNKKVIIFNFTLFFDKITILEKIEYGSTHIISEYQKQVKNGIPNKVLLSEKAEQYFQKTLGKYDDNLRYDVKEMIVEHAKIKNQNLLLKKLTSYFIIFLKVFNISKFNKRLLFIKSLNKPSNDAITYKQTKKTFRESNMSVLEYTYYLFLANRLKKKNLNYYNQHVQQKIDWDAPFVYCPLHFQPEATTSPLGGYYVSQYLMLSMLSKSLPKGWKLYVKEHMFQFIPHFSCEPTRTKEFYNRLKRIPNVEFVSLEIDSYTLIDKCKVVATVTGTVCFEAVTRGRPVFAFGNPTIYQNCEGIFNTGNLEQLKESFTLVINDYQPDINRVKTYIKIVDEMSFPGSIGGEYTLSLLGINRQLNADGHYQALVKYLS